MIDAVLLAMVPVRSFRQDQLQTNASGFLFERDDRLFLVTSRHVAIDERQGHRPDRIEIDLHADADNLAAIDSLSLPLYRGEEPAWREGRDSGGDVDVMAIEIDRAAMKAHWLYEPFTPDNLFSPGKDLEIGTSLLIIGYPLGFQDTLHHLPVARQAALSSAFGLRFQGQGYFMTDARTHRGMSGAPVIAHADANSGPGKVRWWLLGIHSSRLDMGPRDLSVDEALGLNCAWYADILTVLTGS